MKIIAMIPARYGATRFPGKLMANLGGKSVICRTYDSAKSTNLFDEVYVVTDSEIIENEIKSNGGKTIQSIEEHDCGTDRIAEAVKDIDVDIVVNVQGDEPFVNKEALTKLIEVFKKDKQNEIALATLMQELKDWKEITDPNYVKVVSNKNNFAMYFSRSPIPYPRDKEVKVKYYEHIGVYAFRKESIMDFYSISKTSIEDTEKIECIRFLEYGYKIKMIETKYMGIEIDTPEDLEKANKLYFK